MTSSIVRVLAVLVLVALGPLPGAAAATRGSCTPATSWEAASTVLQPADGAFAPVWTGSHVLVWGGGANRNEGGRYDPITDSWSPMTTVGAPTGRLEHTAVWTGNEMIVWGGYDGTLQTPSLASGGRYDPLTDTWQSIADAPLGLRRHAVVWTGSEMIVWGGTVEITMDCGSVRYGYRYDPASDSWTATPLTGAPSLGRMEATAVWTGSEMIVWGGYYANCLETPYFPDDGARYSPQTNDWQPMTTLDAPSGRSGQASVWNGSEMILWGGSTPGTGARYDPIGDAWEALPGGGPDARIHGVSAPPNAAFWGGSGFVGYSGGLFDPATDSWTPLPTTGAPTGTIGLMHITGSLAIWKPSAGLFLYSFGDKDVDGVCDDVDNCPGFPNPDQERVPFPDTILAPDRNQLIWAGPADVELARGDLASVSSYGVTDSGTLDGATEMDISGDAPAAGAGLYYLVRYAHGCGSWQTAPGAEPDRDLVLP